MSAYSGRAFRRSAAYYVGGRVINAVTTFAVFLLLARYLPESEYASYVAAFALMEFGLIVFGFGMEWITGVFVPQVRLKSNGKALARFSWQCVLVQAVLLACGSAVLLILAPHLGIWLQLEQAVIAFRLYAIVLFIDGLSRVFRDQLLACLLLQGEAQAAQMLRNLSMLFFAYTLSTEVDWRTAENLAIAEIVASGLSLALSAGFLARFLGALRDIAAPEPDWQIPSWPKLLRAGSHAWISNLANLSWSGQAVILITTRLLGPDSTAALGFARNLAEQIRRYLPAEFLFGIIRTLLVARYARDGNIVSLAMRTGIMYRINLLFLLPLVAVVIVNGEELCSFLSNGRYGSTAHGMLNGWLAVLVLWAHHRPTDLLAHTLGYPYLTSQSSLALLPVPLLLVWFAGQEDWLLLFATLAMAECLYSVMVLGRLRVYMPNWSALAKQFAGGACVAVLLAQFNWPATSWALAAELALSFALFALLVAALRPWSADERELLTRPIAARTKP